MNLQGRVTLITGAAGSLGRAALQAFSAAGARCVAIDLDVSALRAAPAADPSQRLAFALDLRDADAIGRMVAEVVDRWGRIDALCNIAGGFEMGPAVHETSDEAWSRMMDLNAGTVLRMVRAVAPVMLRQGAGRIVNIGAMGGLAGRAQMGAYSASKSAVIRLTESLSAELRGQGLNVNCVLPSVLDTPANRAAMPGADPAAWVAPAALADVLVFLCSDAARAIHGAAVPVVGLS